MPVSAAFIGGGASILGGYLGGKSNEKAARTSSKATIRAAEIGADAQKFRPVGVTTRFGQSNFQFDPTTGYLTGASYELDPALQGYQDRLQALAEQRLSEAESAGTDYAPLRAAGTSLFQLGNQYLAETPEQVAERYMTQQLDLLAPSRERQYSQLQNQLFQTGRGGLAVGATGTRPGGGAGLGAANPELEAYYNALAQQDAALAAQAQQAGQQQVAFGTGLFNQGSNLLGGYQSGVTSALNPFTTALGGVSTIESLGQQPLDIGAQLGGRAATAGANVGQTLFQGGVSAARTMQDAAYDPWAAALSGMGSNPVFGQGVANLFSGRQLTPADYRNLSQWEISQQGYLDPNYMGP